MWDNPRLLNSVAGVLTGIALLVFMLAGAQLLLRSTHFALREITVRATLAHTSAAQIEQATQGRIKGNFFSVDLEAVRDGIEQLPWVRRVNVRRVWPDGLEVSIEERVALAHWGENALVDVYGERFAAQTDAPLPVFAGPPGTEAEVTRRYRRFAALLAPLRDPLARVTLTPRFAWRLKLRSGLSLELGRDNGGLPVEARLARFVAAYPLTLGKIARRHEYVDLRYPNGFALGVADMNG
jgi:cell division protein FtsQ